jgi:hypothetical protein
MNKAARVAAGTLAIVVTSAPAFAQGGKQFPDVVPDHWAAQAVKMLADKGIIIGYPDGTFEGSRAMTRYEFAMAISRLLPLITQQINDAVKNINIAPGQKVDLTGYATQDYVNNQGFVKGPLPAFATQAQIDKLQGEIDNLPKNNSTVPQPAADLGPINARVDALTGRVDGLAGRVDGLNGRVDNLTTRVDDLNNKIGTIQAMLDRFSNELKGMNVDVDKLKAEYANLDARVRLLERFHIYGTGTVAWESSTQYTGVPRVKAVAGTTTAAAQIMQNSAGVDLSGALFDDGRTGNSGANNGNATGKRGFVADPSVLYDTQIGIDYSPDQKLRIVSSFILGDYYGSWQNSMAASASTGQVGTTSGLRGDRTASDFDLHPYLVYLSYPVTSWGSKKGNSGGVAVGQIPSQMTPFTWKAVNPDAYIDIDRQTSGNIIMTGGALKSDIQGVNYMLFAGYNPTDGTTPGLWIDGSNNSIGFGHYSRPGGEYGVGGPLNYINTSRTHLTVPQTGVQPFYSIPSLRNVVGGRFGVPEIGFNILAGVSSDWTNPTYMNFGTTSKVGGTATSAPTFNRFGLTYSADWNTSLPLKNWASSLPNIGVTGEMAWSRTNNWGATGASMQTSGSYVANGVTQVVNSTQGSAYDLKLAFPVGSTKWSLGATQISPGFNAPGSWGSLGSWVNPWNFVTDSPLSIKQGVGNAAYELPIIPTALQVAVPFRNVPYVGQVNFNVADRIGHMLGQSANSGQLTPISPTSTFSAAVQSPSQFSIANSSMGLSSQYGGYHFGVSSEDVLRDYPGRTSAGADFTELWNALRGLINVQGGQGIHQIAPNAAHLGPGENIIQSDENYYKFSLDKNLTADGSASAKFTLSRVVYTDRTGFGGGSYRGTVGTMQVTYKF